VPTSKTFLKYSQFFLQIFRNGRPYEYKGPRDSKGIVEYMREQLKFPSKEVFNELELKNNLDRLEATIVGFFSNKSDFFNEFTVASNEIRGYNFLLLPGVFSVFWSKNSVM